jgi:hypothetical protein
VEPEAAHQGGDRQQSSASFCLLRWSSATAPREPTGFLQIMVMLSCPSWENWWARTRRPLARPLGGSSWQKTKKGYKILIPAIIDGRIADMKDRLHGAYCDPQVMCGVTVVATPAAEA